MKRNGSMGGETAASCPQHRIASGLLCTSALIALVAASPAAAQNQEWEPFPEEYTLNDFGGVGLIQTPTARFAPDGQFFVGGSRVYPYERYFVTVQGTSWMEATLRYSSVSNRLYSGVPEFSGDQSYKDRGLDVKIKLLGEGAIRPALAIGGRDFLGTGLFSSEYVVLNKNVGPFDASFGIGWGNMGTRGQIKNPFRLISSSFEDRGETTAGGGTLNNAYFKGRRASLFGGISYELPVRGLVAKVEYDPNDYQSEALGNRFDVDSPVNVGLDYRVRPWLHVGASYERGNKFGVRLALTTNFNRRTKAPKIDPPAPPMTAAEVAAAGRPAPTATVPAATAVDVSPPVAAIDAGASLSSAAAAPRTAVAGVPADVDIDKLMRALADQGLALYSADFDTNQATLYVAQTRFRNVATGAGRAARTAFSVLPANYVAAKLVFVEGGVETMSTTMYRAALEKALTPGLGSTDELFARTDFAQTPGGIDDAEYQRDLDPGFFYWIRPGLRTTLGRPEQFLLYQAFVRLNGALTLGRKAAITGSIGFNISDNFDKLRIPSDSLLPRVRSDIKEYLREGKTSIPYLQADYSFNIAPALYGHVYGGLLEEMFGGVGGEVLYRPYDANWALGAEVTYAKQRDFDQWFSLRDYDVVTGHVSAFYHFERLQVDALVKAGRYLAKDWGGTFQLSRTFKSGIQVGAFATFTDVSAREFGEGRFDKGLFLTIPLDILYIRNVRSGIGIGWRPLIRDGGQMLTIRRPLLGTTGAMTMYNMRRDWRDVLD